MNEDSLVAPQAEEPTGAVETPPGPEKGPSPVEPFSEKGEKEEKLFQTLDQLKKEMGGLRAMLDERVRFGENQQKIIDRLHAEVQEYKTDLILQLLKPIAQDLIRLEDDLERVATKFRSEAPPGVSETARLFQDFQATVEDILARYGFEPFQTTEPLFDGKQQQIAQSLPTTDPSVDRQVAQRLRPGLRYRDRVVRRELVNVYAFSSPSTL